MPVASSLSHCSMVNCKLLSGCVAPASTRIYSVERRARTRRGTDQVMFINRSTFTSNVHSRSVIIFGRSSIKTPSSESLHNKFFPLLATQRSASVTGSLRCACRPGMRRLEARMVTALFWGRRTSPAPLSCFCLPTLICTALRPPFLSLSPHI